MKKSILKTIAAAGIVSGACLFLGTPAFAYANEKSCEENEGKGKCCNLGLQDGGGDHWGVCTPR